VVVDPDRQAFDADGETARRYAADAARDPLAFLEYEAVFPDVVRCSPRFRSAFAAAYERIAAGGPIAAMKAALAGDAVGDAAGGGG